MVEPAADDTEDLRRQIEALRQENAALRETESQYRALVHHSNAGIWQIKPSGESVSLNPAMCRLIEIDSPSELEGRSAFEFFTEESLAVMRREHALRFLGMPSLYESELIGARGGRRRVTIAGAPVHSTGGELQCLIGTFWDVTEERRAAEELREAKARLELAIDAAQIALFDWDVASGQVSFWFNGKHVATAPSLEEGLGVAVIPEHREPVLRALREAVADRRRERLDLEYQVRMPDGSICWRSAASRVVRNEAGRALRVIGASVDITAKRAIETRLAAAARIESLGRLAGGIAHDFNNLLTVILSSVSRARRPGGSIEEALADIDGAAECATRLTRQLLAFARRQPMARRPVDLGALLESSCEWLRRALGADVELVLTIAPGVSPVLADPGQLDQVVMNLATNAREAMPEGGRLEIEVSEVDDLVVLQVTDSGHGMDERTRERAVEPFFTTKPSGTGLGLATTYGVVTQLGGVFGLRSAPGEGTTVTVQLPASRSPI
jgi:PAS domain S-box-containing protein